MCGMFGNNKRHIPASLDPTPDHSGLHRNMYVHNIRDTFISDIFFYRSSIGTEVSQVVQKFVDRFYPCPPMAKKDNSFIHTFSLLFYPAIPVDTYVSPCLAGIKNSQRNIT